MNIRAITDTIARESLVFISITLFSGILLPTCTLLLMAIFSDAPRSESILEGYRYLFTTFGGSRWIGYGVGIGPYLLFQCYRVIRWFISNGKEKNPG